MNCKFSVGNRLVGLGQPPFIIAEMSGNHNGSLARAKDIIKAAAEAGADAVKLQTYTADTITIRSDRPEFRITQEGSLWQGRTLYDLYQEAHTPWEWHKELFAYAHQQGILIFSTPFDMTAVDFLMELDVPLFKIASLENTDVPLIQKVAATGKPMIISTGASTRADIALALQTARDAGAKDIVLLKCTSAYPAPPEDANLLTIPHMRETYGVQVGLSDHTIGVGTSIAAVALGATVIEKHVTLKRSDGGVDAEFSLEPQELAVLVEECRRAQLALGSVRYELSEGEYNTLKRSLYVVAPMKHGERFTAANLRSIRPANGLPTLYYERLLKEGIAACDIDAGVPLEWSQIQGVAPE